MAIKKYVYAENDADWIETAAERLQQQGKGANKISYTDYGDSSVNMSITASSYFEVGMSGFYATSDTEVASGTEATGLCYIMATGATVACTIAWSNVAPVWRDDHQGWYATVASSVRALGGCYFDGNSYDDRFIYGEQGFKYYETRKTERIYEQGGNELEPKVIPIGDWNMADTASVNVVHGLDVTKIRTVGVSIRNDTPNNYFSLNYAPTGTGGHADGNWTWDATNLVLVRLSSGTFDASAFSSTSYNRGWATVWYEV